MADRSRRRRRIVRLALACCLALACAGGGLLLVDETVGALMIGAAIGLVPCVLLWAAWPAVVPARSAEPVDQAGRWSDLGFVLGLLERAPDSRPRKPRP